MFGGYAQYSKFGLGLVARHDIAVKEPHLEGCGAAGNLHTYAAQAPDSEGSPLETAGFRVFLLIPDAMTEVVGLIDDSAVERDHEADRQLRDGDGIHARTIADANPQLTRRLYVDGVGSGAGTDDNVEVAGRLKNLTGYLGRSYDQNAVPAAAKGFGERASARAGLVLNFASHLLKLADSALFEFVSNKDLHKAPRCNVLFQ